MIRNACSDFCDRLHAEACALSADAETARRRFHHGAGDRRLLRAAHMLNSPARATMQLAERAAEAAWHRAARATIALHRRVVAQHLIDLARRTR